MQKRLEYTCQAARVPPSSRASLPRTASAHAPELLLLLLRLLALTVVGFGAKVAVLFLADALALALAPATRRADRRTSLVWADRLRRARLIVSK